METRFTTSTYVQSKVTSAHGFCRNTLGLENPDINWGVLEFENGAIDGYIRVTGSTTKKPTENLMWMMSWTVDGLLAGGAEFEPPDLTLTLRSG